MSDFSRMFLTIDRHNNHNNLFETVTRLPIDTESVENIAMNIHAKNKNTRQEDKVTTKIVCNL